MYTISALVIFVYQVFDLTSRLYKMANNISIVQIWRIHFGYCKYLWWMYCCFVADPLWYYQTMLAPSASSGNLAPDLEAVIDRLKETLNQSRRQIDRLRKMNDKKQLQTKEKKWLFPRKDDWVDKNLFKNEWVTRNYKRTKANKINSFHKMIDMNHIQTKK